MDHAQQFCRRNNEFHKTCRIIGLKKQQTICSCWIRCIKGGSVQRIRINVYSIMTYVIFHRPLSFNELCKNAGFCASNMPGRAANSPRKQRKTRKIVKQYEMNRIFPHFPLASWFDVVYKRPPVERLRKQPQIGGFREFALPAHLNRGGMPGCAGWGYH